MKKILRVMKCGEAFSVKSEKAESGTIQKRNLVLQEIGGKYEDQYAVSTYGNLAACVFSEGEIVYAALRFQARDYNGQTFQDITANDIVKLKN